MGVIVNVINQSSISLSEAEGGFGAMIDGTNKQRWIDIGGRSGQNMDIRDEIYQKMNGLKTQKGTAQGDFNDIVL